MRAALVVPGPHVVDTLAVSPIRALTSTENTGGLPTVGLTLSDADHALTTGLSQSQTQSNRRLETARLLL